MACRGLSLVLVVIVARLLAVGPDSDEFLGEGNSVALLLGVGSLMILVGVFYGWLRCQVLRALKIDKTHIWLKDVGPLYLANITLLPYPEGSGQGQRNPESFEF